MSYDIELFKSLRASKQTKPLQVGKSPFTVLPELSTTPVGWRYMKFALLIVFTLVTLSVLWVGQTSFKKALYQGLNIGMFAAMAVGLIYYLFPILSVIFQTFRYQKRPCRDELNHFTRGQKSASLLLIAWGLFSGFNQLMHRWSLPNFGHSSLSQKIASALYVTIWWHEVVIVLLLAVILSFLIPKLLPQTAITSKTHFKIPRSHDMNNVQQEPFGLWVGRSTGRLCALGHEAGILANQEVVLSATEAAQNILVLGGIGSGKTTRMMQPLLLQLLEQGCGGLLFDVKGDVKATLFTLSTLCSQSVTLIGPTHQSLNLLKGLTPETAASFLKSAFMLSGGNKLEGFWIDTATELCRNTLGLLSFLPEYYTLQGLHNFLFDPQVKDDIQVLLHPLLLSLPQELKRLLKSYLNYHDNIFALFDEKVKSGVNATIAQVLAPFNHPELIDAFCTQTPQNPNFETMLKGQIFLIDLPLSKWGLGAKVAYTFIKLKFFNLMQNRIHEPDWNQESSVFFMCDEYQALISANPDGLSDLNFWDKSRSSKTIGIISAQSISSFYAALSSRELTQAILQNFRQKICFRTEDTETLQVLNQLAGQARTHQSSLSETLPPKKMGFPISPYDKSQTYSNSESRAFVLDAPLFRNLGPNQAVALLCIDGYSRDDVLECLPVYL